VASQRRIDLVTRRKEALAPLAEALRLAGFETRLLAEVPPDDTTDLILLDAAGAAALLADPPDQRWLLLVDDAAAMRRGFTLGAEDCVLASAHADEIVARCEAVLRRTTEPSEVLSDEPAVYVDRRLWVNFDSRQVWVGGRPAQLTPREFRLLRHLIQHRDTTLSHEQILAAVWDRPADQDRPTEVLKQYIWRLRQKIEDDPNQPETIVTDPGAGYRFVARVV
jgi:DNA-binding response OmpR family regulator